MAYDVYQPCPFCTDKKLKFCCAAIAEDMEKAIRLDSSGQTRAALKILDKLAVSHPNTVWNQASRSTFLLSDGRGAEALAILEPLHSANPENVAVIALLAAAAASTHGFEAAREHLWRAFRKAAGHADIVSGIAMSVASDMYDREKYLGARAHLTLAMRFAPSEEQQSIFVRLLDFDGSTDVPYPLRSVHSLRELTSASDAGADPNAEAERQDAARRAMRLAERGCYGIAADRFAALLDATPQDAALLVDTALCRAWNLEETAAAELLIRAAAAEPDFEVAAEYAALSQLLHSNADASRVAMKNAEFAIPPAAVTIGDMDAHDRFVRVELPPEALGTAGTPDAVFEVLDRPHAAVKPPAELTLDDLTPEALPRAISQVAIFATLDDADGPRAVLAGFQGDDFEAAKALLQAAAPGSTLVEERIEPGDATLPRDLAPLHIRLSYPEKTPMRLRRQAEHRRWTAGVETWFQTPQAALGDRSPASLAGDASQRVTLAGALYVLDAFALRSRYTIDLESLRQRLELPPVAPLAPQPDLPLNHFSAIQLHRLTIADLEDRQLSVVLNRTLLTHHPRFLGPVLEEGLRRSLPEIDLQRAYATLSDLARERGDQATALHWIEEGRKQARQEEKPFEAVFKLDIRELGLRLEDPTNPELDPFLRRMTSYYGPKVPQFLEYLSGMLAAFDITLPTVLEATGATSSGGLWTPGQPAAGGSGKLWVPGQ